MCRGRSGPNGGGKDADKRETLKHEGATPLSTGDHPSSHTEAPVGDYLFALCSHCDQPQGPLPVVCMMSDGCIVANPKHCDNFFSDNLDILIFAFFSFF